MSLLLYVTCQVIGLPKIRDLIRGIYLQDQLSGVFLVQITQGSR
jgi:hypothetical protein